MRLSRQFLLMSLMFLAGMAGCGPASPDNAPTLGSPASKGELSLSQKNPPPRTDLIASATSSATTSLAPLASGNTTSSVPASSTKPENPMDALVIPKWIAKDLASPDVDTRLRALDIWVLTAPAGSIDPLILAFENDDDRVRARAMELIEQDWTRGGEAGQ
jgi:hypothetical protein